MMIHFNKKVLLDVSALEAEAKRSKIWMRESQPIDKVVQDGLEVYPLKKEVSK